VSSEEIARGKPAPDVYVAAARRYVEAARRLTVEPGLCGARGLDEGPPRGGRG
jgi:beta-phosphoglucomutase-like phosphatase (HAD superfamily)